MDEWFTEEEVFCRMLSNRGNGSVGGGEAGKKNKTTPEAGGKSVSEKSQTTSVLQEPL